MSSSAVQISRDTVKKLTHASAEIRLRTLEQIDAKVQRSLAHNETILFKPGELCKQLIRWFGCQPLQDPTKALHLLLRILQSSYGEAAVEQLRVDRFLREIEKVAIVLRSNTEALQMVAEIQKVLHGYKKPVEDIIEILDALSLQDVVVDSARYGVQTQTSEAASEYLESEREEFEVAWSKPTVADFNAMKQLADILINPLASNMELQNSLQHLQITIVDYPAEYMLQSPNIYLNLLDLYERGDDANCPLGDVTSAILIFLQTLKVRVEQRRKTLAYREVYRKDEVLPKIQLKVGKALEMLLDKSLNQLYVLLQDFRDETTQILEIIAVALEICKLQGLDVRQETIDKLCRIVRNQKDDHEQNEHFTLQRIKYLLMAFLLQDVLTSNSQPGSSIHFEALEPLLRDYTLQVNFPKRYENLKALLLGGDVMQMKKFELLQNYERPFAMAVELLKTPQNFNSTTVIENGASLCFPLEKLKSFKLTEYLLNAIVTCNSNFVGSQPLRETANDLLLRLMRLSHEPLKVFVYEKLTLTVKKHFACLMNGESFCSVLANAKLLEAQIIGVPWSSAAILQLINDSHESTNAQIKQNCEDLLVLFLKAKHLLGPSWCDFLELLMPVLPMLQCCATSKKLMDQLLQLYDPDAKNLPYLSMLKGNIGFLFHKDVDRRSEALTRLMYMLNTLPTAKEYEPNIMEVGDLIPNDICQLKVAREFTRIFAAPEMNYELITMHNLLVLLESPDIEPLIRKTTLMQLNLMCQNWQLVSLFCAEDATYLILQALENSLHKSSICDYTDAAIPAIGVLCKILFYDTEFRRELASTPNIYMLLLRSLFLYPNDIQVREDASLCLFLLLFCSVLVVLPSSYRGVEAPSVVGNLQMPLHCELKQAAAGYRSSGQEFELLFPSTTEEDVYLRHFLAACYCGGAAKVNQKYFDTQTQQDFCKELQLTASDWRLLKATRPTQNLRRFLRAVANATEHTALINATIMLKLQLMLMAADTSRDVPEDIACELYKMLAKYLQLPPGNEMDYLLFEDMVELCDLCVRMPLTCVIVNFTKTLQADYHHACLVLLKNPKTPLNLYRKLCLLLTHLLDSPISAQSLANNNMEDFSIFYSNMFDLLFEVANTFFDKRELQRVRCLLSLLQLLSNYRLNMPDKLLSYYCKRFLNLSIALKSSTQTGAQWQRDCLQLICQLQAQMEAPGEAFRLNAIALKYLSGLCGHNDGQVRALAWCILSICAHTRVNGHNVGIEELTTELSYLPGGFMACCLCTLFDAGEVVLVRQLAGNLFVDLLAERASLEDARLLLDNQDFFTVLHEALRCCILTEKLPELEYDTSFSTCELMSCYCRICIRLSQLDPSFLQEMCEKPFMFKLYELFKVPPEHTNPSYYTMCADICQLYALCYKPHFVFLQHTLCRDNVWLMSFAKLLDQHRAAEVELVSVLHLLLVLCKDTTAYERICEKFADTPVFIVKVLLRSLKVTDINRPLQRCSLAVLTLLLIKSQHKSKCDYKSFAEVIESPVEIEELATGDGTANDQHKEPDRNMMNKMFNRFPSKTSVNSNTKSLGALTATNPGSVFIFMDLFKLFSHLCPTKSCKFDTDPSTSKLQISEAMSVLLKLSPEAQEAAKNVKLLDKIVRIFQIFLDEFSTSCTVFVRRYGETKKMAIITNFQLLFNILLNWFSAPTAVLTDELQALEFAKVLLQIWSWLAHSVELKLLVLKVCAYLSERSLVVCQQFSTLISSYPNSILQLVIKIATFETTTVKASSSETFPVIATALRVIMNCCACAEGRVLAIKAHTLDIFDGLHPFNMKSPRIKPDILHSWLQFWELFSRYNEGAHARNLNSLCEVINRSPPRCATRLLSLKILRNMCFAGSNRTTLLSSTDFVYTINQIISQQLDDAAEDCSYEEHMLVSVAVWKLISGGIKFIAMIRGTKLAKKFRILREHLTTMDQEMPQKLQQLPFAQDLANVLDVIFDILKS